MLDVEKLVGALEAFCDPAAPHAAFPFDAEAAKVKWAAAFYVYVQDLAPTLPTTGVMAAFAGALAFVPSIGSSPGATELAAAWRAAMSTMMTFDDLLAREATLRAALDLQLTSPTIVAATRVHAIASAFDRVTRGITSGGGSIVYG